MVALRGTLVITLSEMHAITSRKYEAQQGMKHI